MQDFFFVELTTGTANPIQAAQVVDVDLPLLEVYIKVGGGPVPGAPGWNFTVDWQQELQGGFYTIVRADNGQVVPAMGGVVLCEEAADSMWEHLERMRLQLYQSMAKAWKHNIPDVLLGVASQPTVTPWVGSILLSPWLTEYPEAADWLMPFQVQLGAALIHFNSPADASA